MCDWGATDVHWLRCEHEAGGCSSLIYKYRRFGLLWFWKSHFTSSQRACEACEPEQTIVQHIRTKQPRDPKYQDCPVGAVRNSLVHAFGKSWTDHGAGPGDRGTMQAAHGQQGRRAGPVWLKVDFHIGNSPRRDKEGLLPWTNGQKNTGGRWKPLGILGAAHGIRGFSFCPQGSWSGAGWDLKLQVWPLRAPQAGWVRTPVVTALHMNHSRHGARKSSSQLTLHSAPLTEQLY